MTLDYESDRLVSFCGAVIPLIPSLLAVSCISKKVPEPAANKEEIEGKKNEIDEQIFNFFLMASASPFCLKCSLLEEDMMMDSVQTAAPAQPTEELTELGKCLMKHEVRREHIR